MATLKRKRFSDEVDKLINQVNKLVNDGMSVNKACQKVGLQPTVYYFRKRKDDALKLKSNVTSSSSSSPAMFNASGTNKSTQKLIEEARELEDRLREIKERILESVMGNKSI